MENINLDPASLKILRILQHDSRTSNIDLAEQVGLSATPCWRRQKELEENGYIMRYAAIVDRRKVGLPLCCMLHVTLTRHAEGVMGNFEQEMLVRSEVLECYEVTGSADYLVKIVVRDMDSYHDFLHKVMFKLPGVAQVNTSVALREVKYATALSI